MTHREVRVSIKPRHLMTPMLGVWWYWCIVWLLLFGYLDPRIFSVIVEGALCIMTPLIVVEWALVEDGGQTVCRHIFDIATILRVFEHSLPCEDLSPYQPMIDSLCLTNDASGSGFVRISASCFSVGVNCICISRRSTYSRK